MNNFKFRLIKEEFKYSFSRKNSTKKILFSAIAILAAVLISACITAMVGFDPFEMIKNLFTKAFQYEPEKLIYNISIFALAGLSFSFAFKANIFNIGISGQMFSAGVTMLIVSNALEPFISSNVLGQLISFVTCVLVSSFFAWTISAMERYFKVNIVVSGILMNWILYLVGFFVISYWYPNTLEGNVVMTGSIDIPEAFTLKWGSLDSYVPIIIITLIISIVIFVIFKFTTFGKKMVAVGLSLDGSKCAGYNVTRVRMVTFIISGAIAGIMALILYTTQIPEIPLTDLNVNVPSEGFNGIAVGLLSNNNPFGIIIVSCLLGLFKTSSSYLWEKPVFNDVILGVLILVIVLFGLLEKYRPWYRLKGMMYKANVSKVSSEYENKINELIFSYKLKLSELSSEKDKKQKNDKILCLSNEYSAEKEKINQEYYVSLVKNIIEDNYNPIEKLEKKKKEIYKYYENEYSSYLSRMKNKIVFIEKIQNKFVNYKTVKKFFKKNHDHISEDEVKLISQIIMNGNLDIRQINHKNDITALDLLVSKQLVVINGQNIIINNSNNLILKFENKNKFIKNIISKRKIRLFTKIKKASFETKKWIQNDCMTVSNKFKNEYKKESQKNIVIYDNEIISTTSKIYSCNKECKNIIENKILDKEVANQLVQSLLEKNIELNKEELW